MPNRQSGLVVLTALTVLAAAAAALNAEEPVTPQDDLIRIDGPAALDRENATYVLTRDVTADGTAFTVEADGVTLDLGGHTVVYNAKPADTPVHAVVTKRGKHKRRLGSGVYGLTVRNGRILQGPGRSKRSHPLELGGQFAVNYDIHHLEIRADGEECTGIVGSLNDSKVHHNVIESRATTKRLDGGYAEGMVLRASLGGLDVFENTVAGGHRGIRVGRTATYAGTYLQKLGGHRRSRVHHNLVQHKRVVPGVKAPYGIALWGSRQVDVFANEVVSDHGRGIIFDMGTVDSTAHDNLIDVQYSRAVGRGAYVENRVYGFRIRYRSGRCRIANNRIFVNNGIEGGVVGIFVGSDNKDAQLDGIEITGNEVHARGGAKFWLSPGTAGIVFDWVDHIKVTGNRITCDACPIVIRHAEDDVTIDRNVLLQPARPKRWTEAITHSDRVTFTGKNETASTQTDEVAPAPPTGLRLTRHLDMILLRWHANARDKDVVGTIVYRDGKKLPITPRAGTFYIDMDPPRGAVSYSLSAIDLSGNEGKRCEDVRIEP